MIPEKLLDVLKHEGAAALVTQGEIEPHLVNTWNSYINISDSGKIQFPAGGMRVTETNIEKNNRIQMTIGCREVDGFNGPGTGFRIKGTAAFLKSGPEFETIKQKFPWVRATLEITIHSITQIL